MTLLAGVRRGAAVERHAATPRISSLIDGDCINEDVSQKNHRSKTKLFMICFRPYCWWNQSCSSWDILNLVDTRDICHCNINWCRISSVKGMLGFWDYVFWGLGQARRRFMVPSWSCLGWILLVWFNRKSLKKYIKLQVLFTYLQRGPRLMYHFLCKMFLEHGTIVDGLPCEGAHWPDP